MQHFDGRLRSLFAPDSFDGRNRPRLCYQSGQFETGNWLDAVGASQTDSRELSDSENPCGDGCRDNLGTRNCNLCLLQYAKIYSVGCGPRFFAGAP